MRSGLRKKLDDLNLKIESIYRVYSSRKKAKKRLKRMGGGFDLEDKYEKIILPFWKKYNQKPKKYWYEIFSDRSKNVDPRYIPDDMWFSEIIPYYSNPLFRRFGEDKCLHDRFFPDLKKPDTLVKNIAGILYDKDMNIINIDQAIDICNKFKEEFLIKPSIDSGEGRLIQFFNSENNTKTDIIKSIDNLKANYIIQAAVKQHPEISKLNPSSLNTIRIISFLFKNEVHILSSIIRVGASNSKVDNIGAGGFAIPIHDNGVLYSKGVNRKAEWVDNNLNGIKFGDIRIPNYLELIEIIKKTHAKQAHFKIIGWDFSIDENENPIFIEYNTCPGPNQITMGPTFGDLTEEVLQDVFIDKNLKYAQN